MHVYMMLATCTCRLLGHVTAPLLVVLPYVQGVFARIGLDLGIADTPERNCKACAKGHGGTLCCHQCTVPRDRLADPTVDLLGMERTKGSIAIIRNSLSKMTNQEEQAAESTRLGVVVDLPGIANPFDEIHFDATRQMPPEALHQDLRVCDVTV